MNLIPKSDPQYFTHTSDLPYDRHMYKLTLSNGKTEIYECYMDVQARWFKTPSSLLKCIEILDKTSDKKSKGFV